MDAKINDVQETETPMSVEDDAARRNPKRSQRLEQELTVAGICRRHKLVVWWCCYWTVAAVGWYGFGAQINGAMISVPSVRRDFGYTVDGEAILPADWQSAFNIISTVSQFFGGFICSWLADRIGRKSALLIGVAICSAGCIGEIVSATRPAFLGSKLVLGVGLRFYLTLAPMMCRELAPVALRGIATAGVNLGIAVGQLISNSLAGLDDFNSFDLGVGVTACGVLGNIGSWFIVERFGRRKLFLFGMMTLSALLLLIGIMDVVSSQAAKWVQAAGTVIHAFIYFLTIGAVAFTILGESSSTVLRAKTIFPATATRAIRGLVMDFAVPYMVNTW
ncbi:maltose permease [Metarhizium acridum CQMa 102]|uniref:Maltose permease n=1 Tax=Metarhizium acridum (strain CQMa 102) TaxID=655827 RepID=E9E8Z7_METAQ|nr:maltose permease [Metarhizium acridum CQMa 102]EFY87633.1 maltose permease [Metarhizium acridum CQMa 102]